MIRIRINENKNLSKMRRVLRYCGEIRLYVAFDDYTNEWVVSINTIEGRKAIRIDTTNWIGCGNAVDTPTAYDVAARTALVFAVDEDSRGEGKYLGIEEHCAYNEDYEFHIGRSFKGAWLR